MSTTTFSALEGILPSSWIKDVQLLHVPSFLGSISDFRFFQLPSTLKFASIGDLKSVALPPLPSLRAIFSAEEAKTTGAIVLGIAASGTLIFFIRKAEKKAPDVEITTMEDFRQLQAGGLVRDLCSWLITPTVTAVRVTNYGTRIHVLPSGVYNLVKLKELNISGNSICDLPTAGLSKLTSLVSLDVSNNKLQTLPNEIGSLKSLCYLNAMGNVLTSLPDTIGNLSALVRLGLKGNKLTTLPSTIGKLRQLKELFLTDNELISLPDEISQCESLVKLQASHNALDSLPAGLLLLPKLELLRVACCNISDMPNSISNAPVLSWLSLATNPVCKAPSPRRTVPTVTLQDIVIGRKIGEGASGEVFEAIWKGRNPKVAVKLFRSDRSPDGHNAEEINISVALSDRHLVKVLARINEPDVLGLVMEYVHGTPLAEKPNSESLLRCRWAPEVVLSLGVVLNIAAGVASALEAMHARGIIHGDVYAHNVLADEEGNAVLCDYGASFYVPRTSSGKNGSLAYELQDTRAFGLFLRDLLTRIELGFEGIEAALDVQKQLLLLMQQCLGPPSQRPSMSDMTRKLKSLSKSAASRGATPRSGSSSSRSMR